jgi:hypothetical protein
VTDLSIGRIIGRDRFLIKAERGDLRSVCGRREEVAPALSRAGRDGDIHLGRPAEAITLREICRAVLGEKGLSALLHYSILD